MQQASRLGGRDRHAETRPSPQPRSASGTKDNFGQPQSPSLAVRSLAWIRLPARTDHGWLPMWRAAIAGLPNSDVAGHRPTRSANLARPDGPQVPRSVDTTAQEAKDLGPKRIRRMGSGVADCARCHRLTPELVCGSAF